MITAQDIAKLREQTGAGMMDCKKALEEAGGDAEKAGEILRKKGIVKAAKRTDKIAAEGLTAVKVNGNSAAIVELNAETDFVAKSDDFKNLLNAVVESVLATQPNDPAEALNNAELQNKFNEAVMKIGEKLNLRRLASVQAVDGETLGAYVHMGGKISALILLTGGTTELASEIAMHVAASNPKYLNRDAVDPALVAKEKEIASEQLRTQNKPENIIENIVKGKLDKFYGEICLLEQPFIKDEEKTVEKFAAESGAIVKAFWRFELGEGIEKKSNDFASEVAEQLK
jgi:elongation factor Ts